MKKIFLIFLFLSACVNIPIENNYQNVEIPYETLKEPFFSSESSHFIVRAYDMNILKIYSQNAERIFNNILQETGLYSFYPQNPYEIIVYKNKEEYLLKTKAKEWSSGITYKNAILIYEQEDYNGILAHELTHLIFNEFMGEYSNNSNLFINEGLAVYFERKNSSYSNYLYSKIINEKVKNAPMNFYEIMGFTLTERENDYVLKFYAQTSSIIEYLIRKEGSFKFSILLRNMKKGYSFDLALKEAYPGVFNSSNDLERQWKYWLGI